MQLNFTPELAQLMIFTGETATAIRMYSAYSGGSPSTYLDKPADPKREAIDLMFLADALHHLSRLGEAVAHADTANLVSVCDDLLRIFRDYPREQHFWGHLAKSTFELGDGRVRLDLAIDALARA